MTLFFLILLTVSVSIYVLQKLQKRKKPTIKPSLPKTEEKPLEMEKPASMIEQPKSPEPPPLLTADSKPKLISGQEKQQEPKPPANLPV